MESHGNYARTRPQRAASSRRSTMASGHDGGIPPRKQRAAMGATAGMIGSGFPAGAGQASAGPRRRERRAITAASTR
jgi:hypothetical protein